MSTKRLVTLVFLITAELLEEPEVFPDLPGYDIDFSRSEEQGIKFIPYGNEPTEEFLESCLAIAQAGEYQTLLLPGLPSLIHEARDRKVFSFMLIDSDTISKDETIDYFKMTGTIVLTRQTNSLTTFLKDHELIRLGEQETKPNV